MNHYEQQALQEGPALATYAHAHRKKGAALYVHAGGRQSCHVSRLTTGKGEKPEEKAAQGCNGFWV